MSTRDIGNNLLRPGIDTEQQVRTKLLGTSVRVPGQDLSKDLGGEGSPLLLSTLAIHTERFILYAVDISTLVSTVCLLFRTVNLEYYSKKNSTPQQQSRLPGGYQ